MDAFTFISFFCKRKTMLEIQLPSSHADKYKLLNSDSSMNTHLVFSAEKRKQESKTPMELIYSLGAILASLVVKDGVMYIGSADNNFYALE
jgi:hypothetical protein